METFYRRLSLLLALCFMSLCLAVSGLAEADEGADTGTIEDRIDVMAEPARIYSAADAEEDAENQWTDNLGASGAAVPDEGLEVYYLDLGRVDGILIRCDGETAFIDVGFKKDAKPAVNYLKYLGVGQLDYYIASHGHADHVGGAAKLIDAMKPKRLYLNRRETLQAILEPAGREEAAAVNAAETVILKAGDTFAIGSARLKCLGPLSVQRCDTGAYAENYNSMILRMDYNGHSFLFTGDTTDKILRAVNRRFPGELDVDVLKNPHHNGAHDRDVINIIKPKITVICTGNESQPTKKYQKQLREQGSEVYITGSDNRGNVVIACQGDDMEVRCGYPVDGIALQSPPPLYVSQEYTLKGKIEPSSRGKTRWLNWKSSDESVVTVSSGKLRAVGEGTATVTVSTFNGLTATAEIQVYSAMVEVEFKEVSIAIGEEKKLRARIVPEGAQGVSGQWMSADESIVVCLPNGEIIGAKTGSTQVIAQLSNGAQAVCNVTVSGFPVDSVTLDKKKAKLKVGDSLTLKATVKPEQYAAMPLEWASSDERILWVDSNGNVTAVGKGTAKIGVRASAGKYAICTIKVE